MSSASVGLADKPAHVPQNLVRDWDFGDPAESTGGPMAVVRHLRQMPDVFWTPRNGGHWVVTRAADIEYVQKHADPFSMRSISLPDEGRPRVLPIEMDPPEHTKYRTLINSFFTPRAAWRSRCSFSTNAMRT